MQFRTVEVSAASRLHFGLFSFGHPQARQFGGVGAMVDPGSLRLMMGPAERLSIAGPLSARVSRAIGPIASRLGLPPQPAVAVEIVAAPAEHVGLGTGTQLSLALAAALNAGLDRPPLAAEKLAQVAGRGARSAIGTHGFLRGGLLVEHGKLPDQSLAPLDQRLPLPDAWRFVLVSSRHQRGLWGDDEERAFAALSPVDPQVSEHLLRLVERELVPAALAGDSARFGEGLYEFGHTAGMCFAARQGGPFNGPRVAQLVEMLRGFGVRGVGQSSWGPTVYALAADEDQARSIQDRLVSRLTDEESSRVVAPAHTGARVSHCGDSARDVRRTTA